MRNKILLSATTALVFPAVAFAQSTGTTALESDIIITAAAAVTEIGGLRLPDTSKPRLTLTEEAILRQTPGQTILDTIKLMPGVNFQNNDGYGSAGGTLTIRGFDSSRISLTWDGMQLNDSGNYAIYSNQQLDPEVIERVTVSLGSTDVDSPTASAAGGTVGYQTRLPREQAGILASASVGKYAFHRVFAVVDTGELGSLGTRAFISGSRAVNDNPFNDYGQINKKQVNGRIYQPIGDNGDFISVAGHYNENRNNFFGSVGLRNDRPVTGGWPQSKDERFYSVERCTTAAARPGVADLANSCGSSFDERWNPSNTGNIRVQSRFTLAENLILTVDPNYQSVKANGGGGTVAREWLYNANGTGIAGYIGGRPYAGVDLNGDGDTLDEVRVLTPSQTRTKRFGVAASLIYEINDAHRVRLAYTFDRAKHRQTGEVGYLDSAGRPFDVFPVNDPILDAAGNPLQKRDRKSIAMLNQIAGEYVGRFADNRLVVNAGLRVPFFKRDLNQYCFTTSASGFVDCFAGNTSAEAAYAAANPNAVAPISKNFKYDKLLPNLGFVYHFTDNASLFASYARGMSAPATDNLYNSFFFEGAPGTVPQPETTDTLDGGVRYLTGNIQAQIAGWFTKYKNRTASAFDPDLNEYIIRNLGKVDKWGIDGSVSWSPIREVTAYAFGSYLNSEIKDDLQIGVDATGNPLFAATGGKTESGSPTWTFGGRLEGRLGPIELGVQAKRTGSRYVYDTNLPVMAGATSNVQVFTARAPAYTLVDLDARFSLASVGLERSYLQFNVSNLFDKLYVGGFGGNLNQTGSPPFVQIGAPRTISGTFVVGF
ncbi:MAG: TonB-dependent receptor [Sphingomonadaceae bacterium]